MSDLVFELFSEEIPAGMQQLIATHLHAQVHGAISELGLTYETFETLASPRRLAVVVTGLPARTQDVTAERKGPRVGAPDAALDGFLKSAGISRDALEERDGIYFVRVHTPGKPTAEALHPLLEKAANALPWPKSMRWGDHEMRWVRPLRSVTALLDDTVIAVKVGHVVAGNVTYGHRFLAPEAIRLSHARDYLPALDRAFVTPDADVRKRRIMERAHALVASRGLRLKEDPGLLDEVAGLVEYPVVLMGGFEDAYLSLPLEVPSTVMKSHQKYFTVLREDGSLAPHFVFVSNMQTKDGGEKIIAGNERVLRARLSDGKFFWDQDVRTPLSDLAPKLEGVIFHAKLGTVAEKVSRIRALATALAPSVPGADAAKVSRAAELCKADLISGMVGEFPELQGVMGRYYALQQNEPTEVADAIRDHHRPLGPSDECPKVPVSIAVALADKLDTLAGMFAVGEKPTGSKDPFALRRAALGVVRLILENGLRLRLETLLAEAVALHGYPADSRENRTIVNDLLAFLADRLKVMMKDEGVGHDRIAAVFESTGGSPSGFRAVDDLSQLVARARALEAFLSNEDGANLLAAYKRARNIVVKAKLPAEILGQNPVQGTQSEERALYHAFGRVDDALPSLLEKEDYRAAMTQLAAIRPEMDAFFDKVTVMADEESVRLNRLRLLDKACLTFEQVANFALIEG